MRSVTADGSVTTPRAASPQNLLLPADDPDSVLVTDWGFGSLLPAGFDLGQLLVGLMHAGQAGLLTIAAPDEATETLFLQRLQLTRAMVDMAAEI
jgi:hypothetical protein